MQKIDFARIDLVGVDFVRIDLVAPNPTYIYTSFVSNSVLAKSVAVSKMPKLYYSIACYVGRILHGHVAIISKLESTLVLRTNWVHHFWYVMLYWSFSQVFSTAVTGSGLGIGEARHDVAVIYGTMYL